MKSTNVTKTNRVISIAFAVVAVLAMCLCATFAAGAEGEIVEGIKGGLGQVYKIITAVVMPVAVVCFAFCAYQIFAGGEKGMETAKKIAIYTIVGVGIVYLAPVIVQEISGWFAEANATGTSAVFG